MAGKAPVPVLLVNTGEILKSVMEAQRKYNVDDGNIVKCCRGKIMTAGKLQGKPMVWRYYDLENQSVIEPHNAKRKSLKWKPVVLENTLEYFDSLKQASSKYGVSSSSILSCCRGRLKSAGKTKDRKKLVWRFPTEEEMGENKK